MNFSSMDYFIAVAEEKSFTHAAARVGVTQQTLSAHVAGLEQELGCTLVDRRVPLELTYAGEVFLDYAHRFQNEARAMRQEFRDIASDERGNLRVGIAATRGHIIMPASIASFQAAHPGIAVELVEGENDWLVDKLKEGYLDMVVATVPASQSSLVVRDLYREEVVLLVSQDLLDELYGQRADDVCAQVERTGSLAPLKDMPYLLLGKTDVPGDVAWRVFEESGVTPTVAVRSKNSETLVALARRGVGACFCPRELVQTAFPDGDLGRMRTIALGPEATYWIHAAWRRSAHVWSVIAGFHDTLCEQLEASHHTSGARIL